MGENKKSISLYNLKNVNYMVLSEKATGKTVTTE